jgi:negative regulator of sigma E activity
MAMTDDPFFARLRQDARPLRHEPDEATLARIRVRIRTHLQRNQPTVAQMLAAWFRPIVAAAAAIALAAAIGINMVRTETVSLSDTVLEISLAGETWRVGD